MTAGTEGQKNPEPLVRAGNRPPPGVGQQITADTEGQKRPWEDDPGITLHMARWISGQYAAVCGRRGQVHHHEGPAAMSFHAANAGSFLRSALSAWAREKCPQALENGAPEVEDHGCSRCPEALEISERTLELEESISAGTGGDPRRDKRPLRETHDRMLSTLYGAIALVAGAEL